MTIDDDATANEEFRLQEALKFRKAVPLKTGYCLNCLEKINDNHSYCSLECRTDYEKRVTFSKGSIL